MHTIRLTLMNKTQEIGMRGLLLTLTVCTLVIMPGCKQGKSTAAPERKLKTSEQLFSSQFCKTNACSPSGPQSAKKGQSYTVQMSTPQSVGPLIVRVGHGDVLNVIVSDGAFDNHHKDMLRELFIELADEQTATKALAFVEEQSKRPGDSITVNNSDEQKALPNFEIGGFLLRVFLFPGNSPLYVHMSEPCWPNINCTINNSTAEPEWQK